MISDIFKRGVTVRVSGILIQDRTMLLIAHKKNGEIYWLLPGGGVKYGESLSQALRREFREELGISVEVDEILFICDSIDPRGKRHILNISFGCAYRGGEYRLGDERRLHDYGFFTGQEITGKRLYPPINTALTTIIDRKKHDFYLGCLWLT